ncbi:glycoside hydrolase family protein [Venturia nashicola]|nr:glycoside hydrolase family protein [Venturia nashicola]
MNDYRFPSEPRAHLESTITGKTYRFTLIDDKVLRYEWSADGRFEDRASTFAINRKFKKPEFRVEDTDSQLEIFTPRFHLIYDKQRFSENGLVVQFTSKQSEWGAEWRYGSGPQQNLGGTARTLDGVDGRCDMGAGILSRVGYAALDDTGSMLFDGEGFVATRLEGDRIDGYLFAYGFDLKGAMKSFYAISGSQPVVPRWCLGNWWSRYHDYTADEYLELMDDFKKKDIPMSVAVIDMDWHMVSGHDVPHVGWTGYTWDKNLFPDPDAFAKALHDRKLKITLNDHPHAGVWHHEDSYNEMAKVLGHDTTNKKPILFDPTSQEFMHAFLHVLHRNLEKEGCDFWWIDWQQGSHSRVPGLDPLWLLNHFHFIDQEQVKGKSEALIFSRYAGPGSHRYPVGFSGDAFATWPSLEFQPEFTATASNIGYGWWSHDIGGHLPGFRDDECATRWVQLAVFSPILRLHSSRSRWMSKEPWLYRSECEIAMRDAMQLRHRLVPYIYSENANGPASSLPLVQPMYWNFPKRNIAYKYPNQFYFGSELIVSPVVTPRDSRTNLARTKVWIPPARHVDLLAGLIYDGDREIDVYRSLNDVPVFAKEGTIIPLDGAEVLANGCGNPDAFEVLVVVGQDGTYNLLEDTRDDAKPVETKSPRSILIDYKQADGKLTVDGNGRAWIFRFISFIDDISTIKVSPADAEVSITSNPTPSLTVKIPPTTDKITINLGSDPQLAVLDNTNPVSDILVNYQININIKDEIWKVLTAEQATVTKIGRLLSLGLEEALVGPLVEYLVADSRTVNGGMKKEKQYAGVIAQGD